jgi:hypothetical protein
MDFQTCTACGKTKELTGKNWHRNAATPTGFVFGKCRVCMLIYGAERRRRIKIEQGYGTVERRESAQSRSFDEACLKEKLHAGKSSGYSIYKRV